MYSREWMDIKDSFANMLGLYNCICKSGTARPGI